METLNGANPFGIQSESQNTEENKIEQNSIEQQSDSAQENVQNEQPNAAVFNEKKEIDIFEILSISWKKFKENWKFFVILSLIYVGVNILEQYIKTPLKNSPSAIILTTIFTMAVNVLIAIGIIQIYLKISRGFQAQYDEIFGGVKYFWKFVGASILYGLILLAGYLLLIIPGIIWQFKYAMFSYLVVDKDMSPMDALRESGRIMQGNKWKLFFLQLLMVPIIIGGILFFGVGILVAIPVVTLMSVTFYKLVSGEKN